jgi:hypothetical protein
LSAARQRPALAPDLAFWKGVVGALAQGAILWTCIKVFLLG